MNKIFFALIINFILVGCSSSPYIKPHSYRDKTLDYKSSQAIPSLQSSNHQHPSHSIYALPPEPFIKSDNEPDLWPPTFPKAN